MFSAWGPAEIGSFAIHCMYSNIYDWLAYVCVSRHCNWDVHCIQHSYRNYVTRYLELSILVTSKHDGWARGLFKVFLSCVDLVLWLHTSYYLLFPASVRKALFRYTIISIATGAFLLTLYIIIIICHYRMYKNSFIYDVCLVWKMNDDSYSVHLARYRSWNVVHWLHCWR